MVYQNNVRVIAPSRSLCIVDEEQRRRAENRLVEAGFNVSYAKNVFERDEFDVVPLEKRIADINSALDDDSVHIIISAIGGFSSSEILPYLRLEKFEKKIFVGMSDVSVLLNYIFFETGIPTVHGPHFSTVGIFQRQKYLEDMLQCALDFGKGYFIEKPPFIGSENWYLETENWSLRENPGEITITEGLCEGVVIGGNIPTMVGRFDRGRIINRAPFIVFLEIHSGFEFLDYVKWVRTIIDEIGMENISGLVFGKWPPHWNSKPVMIEYFKKNIRNIYKGPAIMELDFGHNMPCFAFRIGGQMKMHIYDQGCAINVLPASPFPPCGK